MSKKVSSNKDEIKAEYDFSKMKDVVQGKYYKSYRAGYEVKIHKIDGSTTVQHSTLEDGAVMLEPEVKKYFPDSDSVNNALRCLIPFLSGKIMPR